MTDDLDGATRDGGEVEVKCQLSEGTTMQGSRVSRFAVLSASALLIVMLMPGLVLAAAPHKAIFPMSLTVAVSGDTATVTVDVALPVRQITSCTYAIDGGPAIACGSANSVGRKAASLSIAFLNLPVGDHSVRVDIGTSKDGGYDVAAFTILPPT